MQPVHHFKSLCDVNNATFGMYITYYLSIKHPFDPILNVYYRLWRTKACGSKCAKQKQAHVPYFNMFTSLLVSKLRFYYTMLEQRHIPYTR